MPCIIKIIVYRKQLSVIFNIILNFNNLSILKSGFLYVSNGNNYARLLL